MPSLTQGYPHGSHEHRAHWHRTSSVLRSHHGHHEHQATGSSTPAFTCTEPFRHYDCKQQQSRALTITGLPQLFTRNERRWCRTQRLHGRITVIESIKHRVVIATVRLHLSVPSLRLRYSKQARAVSTTGSPQRFSRASSPLASHATVLRARYSSREHNGAGRYCHGFRVLSRSVMFFAVFSPYGRKMQKNIPSLSQGHSHCYHEH